MRIGMLWDSGRARRVPVTSETEAVEAVATETDPQRSLMNQAPVSRFIKPGFLNGDLRAARLAIEW